MQVTCAEYYSNRREHKETRGLYDQRLYCEQLLPSVRPDSDMPINQISSNHFSRETMLNACLFFYRIRSILPEGTLKNLHRICFHNLCTFNQGRDGLGKRKFVLTLQIVLSTILVDYNALEKTCATSIVSNSTKDKESVNGDKKDGIKDKVRKDTNGKNGREYKHKRWVECKKETNGQEW